MTNNQKKLKKLFFMKVAFFRENDILWLTDRQLEEVPL
jgi:hypothetical protein